MLRRLRHIAASLFLLLSVVIVTPVQFLHECHDTAISHTDDDGQAKISKEHFKCPLCDFQVSQFIQDHTNYAVDVKTFNGEQHEFKYCTYTAGISETPDNKGPPALI